MKNRICEKIIRHETRRDGSYTYDYILKEIQSERVPCYKLPLYSVEIRLTDAFGKRTEAETKELFADVGRATSFYEMLERNLATPIDLPYIVEDELIH